MWQLLARRPAGPAPLGTLQLPAHRPLFSPLFIVFLFQGRRWPALPTPERGLDKRVWRGRLLPGPVAVATLPSNPSCCIRLAPAPMPSSQSGADGAQRQPAGGAMTEVPFPSPEGPGGRPPCRPPSTCCSSRDFLGQLPRCSLGLRASPPQVPCIAPNLALKILCFARGGHLVALSEPARGQGGNGPVGTVRVAQLPQISKC